MKQDRGCLDYLRDIRYNAGSAVSFIGEMSLEEFTGDIKTQYAVVRALEIIGEATKQLPADLKRKYGDVPWREMAGMRDRLVHDYTGVDPHIVWETVKRDLPQHFGALDHVIHVESEKSESRRGSE